MALGTFSGGGLGMGVAFTLVDKFTQTAQKIQAEMGKLDGATAKMAQKVNRSMNMMKAGAGLAAVGGIILAPFVKGIQAASDLEENINKVDVAFGDYAGKIKKFSETSIDNYGIDRISALEMTGLFGDMATGMGMSQDKAADMSEKMTALVGDIASFKNISHEMAQEKLTSVFDGQSRKLLSLGIVMNQAALEAFALKKGFDGFKDLNDVEKAQLRFQFIIEKSKNAVGDYIRTADGFANSKRTFSGTVKEMSANLGMILLPIVSKMYQVMSKMVKIFNKFSQTKAGKTILALVAALGALLFIGGLIMVMMGGMRFLLLKSASAFGTNTKATLIATMANQGFAASLRSVGAAFWVATGPAILVVLAIMAIIAVIVVAWKWMDKGSETMARLGFAMLAILGPIGWVIAAIVGIRRGFRDLASWDGETAVGGILGFFMKIAGTIKAVGQVWNSFNGDTFTLTKKLADKLEALGILKWVLKIGTVVSRVKAIWNRVVKGFVVGWGVLKGYLMETWNILKKSFSGIGKSFSRIFKSIKKAVQPLIDIFHKITGGMFKMKGSLGFWKSVGDFIGKYIVGIFKVLGFTIKWVVQIVAWLVEGIIWAISKIIEGVMWLVGLWVDMWVGMGETAWEFVTALFDIGSTLYNVGVSVVQSLWDGFKAMFPNVATWLEYTVGKIFDTITAPFKWIAEKTGQAWDWATGSYDDGVSADDGLTDGQRTGRAAEAAYESTMHQNSTKSPTVLNTSNTTNNSEKQPITIPIILDGQVISEAVIENLELKQARE